MTTTRKTDVSDVLEITTTLATFIVSLETAGTWSRWTSVIAASLLRISVFGTFVGITITTIAGRTSLVATVIGLEFPFGTSVKVTRTLLPLVLARRLACTT